MGINERRKREKELRERLILDSARELFFNNDYENVTMNDIARAAELGKGTLYSYFESKESIYGALLMEGLEMLKRAIEKAAGSGGDALTRLLALYAAYQEFYRKHPAYFRIIFFMAHKDISALVSRRMPEGVETGREIREVVAKVVEQGVEEGTFTPCDSMLTADVLWSSAMGVIMMIEMQKRNDIKLLDNDDEEMFARIAQILIIGLTARTGDME